MSFAQLSEYLTGLYTPLNGQLVDRLEHQGIRSFHPLSPLISFFVGVNGESSLLKQRPMIIYLRGPAYWLARVVPCGHDQTPRWCEDP